MKKPLPRIIDTSQSTLLKLRRLLEVTNGKKIMKWKPILDKNNN